METTQEIKTSPENKILNRAEVKRLAEEVSRLWAHYDHEIKQLNKYAEISDYIGVATWAERLTISAQKIHDAEQNLIRAENP